MEYWQNIINLAKINNLTTTMFGQKTGLAPNYLFKIKKYKYEVPSKKTLMKICNAFKVEPQDIYEKADKAYFEQGKDNYIRAFWNQMIQPLVEEQHLTVTKLAKESGVSRVYLSAVKNGRIAYPAPQELIKLAHYFNANPYVWFQWISDNLSITYLRNRDIYNYEEFEEEPQKQYQ